MHEVSGAFLSATSENKKEGVTQEADAKLHLAEKTGEKKEEKKEDTKKWWDFCPANNCPEKRRSGDTRIYPCTSKKDLATMGIDWDAQSGDGREQFYKYGGNGQLATGGKHDLAKGAALIDIGSYTGETLKGFAKNNPQVDVFTYEPTQQYFNILEKNMKPYKNVHAFNVGIGPNSVTLCFKLMGDATEVVPPLSSDGAVVKCDEAHGVKPGKILPAEEVFSNFIKEGRTIDAIQINCEGCEYIVLPVLMALSKVTLPSSNRKAIDLISRVDVQFHAVGLFREKYCEVFLEMSRHFDIKSNYDIVWTTFLRKGDSTEPDDDAQALPEMSFDDI